MSPQAIIELRGVRLEFGSNIIHRNISFSIHAGESVTILGPSGTGKTLILKMIAGLLQPTAGDVRVLGQRINDLSEEELQKIRTNIGVLFQGAALFDSLTVYENIAYSLREAGEKNELKIQSIVHNGLELIGLFGVENKYPQQLSGGQKKRVGLARALAREPRIMLFDEPTTGLDPTATRLIDDLVVKLQKEMGITCISVTHDISSASRISDRWILVDSGVVLADGPAKDVSRSCANVQNFISGNWKDL